jgi:hypothetical protein
MVFWLKPSHMEKFERIFFFSSYYYLRRYLHFNNIPKTAICTPFGLFEYMFMPFGLKNAAQTFQRLMDKLFRHLPFLFMYLDDILIASKDLAEHMRHLRQVFEILQSAGLQINPSKCTCSVSSLTFLGHNVNSSGISPMGETREGTHRFSIAVGPDTATAFPRADQFLSAIPS